MTERWRVYSKVSRLLKKIIKGQKQGHVTTLAMMITGIVLGHKAQLAVMSGEVPVDIKETSVEMRMRRWVKNGNIDVEITYMPFARQILQVLSSAPLVLAMDGSTVGRGCMVLMVCVIYQKRALPLAWVVYKGKKGHTTAERHIEVLKKVLPLIPEGAEVILLGDAEYDTVEMLEWVVDETNWFFAMRTSPNIQVRCGQTWRSIASFAPSRAGRIVAAQEVEFTKTAAMTLNLWLGGERTTENPYSWSPTCPTVAGLAGSTSGDSALKRFSLTKRAVASTSIRVTCPTPPGSVVS